MSYDFITFARSYGVEIENLYPSDRIRRCGTVEHPKSKNGAYLWDGERGWVQAWDGDCEVYWWDDPNKQEPTPEQKREWAKKKAEREAAQLRLWGATAIRCRMLLDGAVVGEHNYMHRKGLGDVLVPVLAEYEQTDSEGVIETLEQVMVVPMFNLEAGALVGLQLIWWDDVERSFQKKFVPGSRLMGSAMIIGPSRTDEVVLCEGFATGHSINAALTKMRLRATVVVAFNDSNMVRIAESMKHVQRRYVFADHDKSQAGEKAAIRTGLSYCMSPVEGEDANDLHQRAGLVELQKLIMTARKLKATA